MKLLSIRVKKFRNIIDSGDIDMEGNIVCLVGKNESGKTAILHALYRLNPVHDNVKFSIPDHYPAWLEKRDRLNGEDLDKTKPISARFQIDETDETIVAEHFGKGIISKNAKLTLSRDYSGSLWYQVEVSEQAFVRHIVDLIDWPRGTKTDAKKSKTIEELQNYCKALPDQEGEEGQSGLADVVEQEIRSRLGDKNLNEAVWSSLFSHVPRFLYFAEYSTLPYSVDINRLLKAKLEDLSEDEITARSLLQLAAAEEAYLNNPDYERRKRELENTANSITQDVLRYWSQNPDLRVNPDITQKTVADGNGKHAVLDELKIRIWDQRHLLSLPFNEHSTGFRWFFSFLAAFSEYECRNDPLVILLDEPALGLHARAQADFLRFIEERLAVKNQVIYTTHSPFMIQPGHLERVRLVEDKGMTEGVKVSADVTTTDPDTLFPLQGALGYDLVQHLFISPHNLVVEGTSDYTYLSVISDYLKSLGTRPPLDDKWSIVPVGGIDLIPTFVALLGNHLDVTVLIDSQKGGHQKLSRLVSQGILKTNRIISIGHLLDVAEADIEDLFEPDEYLELFNNAYGTSIACADLTGDGPIVKRIARTIGQEKFDHGLPADRFLRERDQLLSKLSEETLNRFQRLFETVNDTITQTPN